MNLLRQLDLYVEGSTTGKADLARKIQEILDDDELETFKLTEIRKLVKKAIKAEKKFWRNI
jgi:uncharacterized protein with von Willebrand factor type A (vWA) domain